MESDISKFFIENFKKYQLDNQNFNFEIRQEQIKFINKWFNHINKKNSLLIDAPTGIGKTFGYLIPIIYKLKKVKEGTLKRFKTLITTSTINLQEQIFNKDIPLLKKVFPIDFDIKLLKGRNNYLCLRKGEKLLPQLWRNVDKESKIFLDWFSKTKTGEYQEIENQIPLSIWKKVESSSTTCLNRSCINHTKCYFFNAKLKADKADIILSNNHFLITDSYKKENPIINKIDYIIIDEAHNFLSSIESVLTTSFNNFENNFQFKELKNFLKNPILKRFMIKESVIYKDVIDDLLSEYSILFKESELFFDNIKEIIAEGTSININNCSLNDSDEKKLFKIIKDFIKSFNNFYTPLKKFINDIEYVIDNLSEKQQSILKPVYLSFLVVFDYFDRVSKILNRYYIENFYNLEVVKWIESTYSGVIKLEALPLNEVSEISKKIFIEDKSYLLTSATLVLDNKFTHITSSLLIKNFTSLKLSSPFDLKKQVKFNVANIKYQYQDKDYYKKIVDILLRITKNGHSLILFSSYKDMNTIFDKFSKRYQNKDISLFMQGETYSRSKMIELFKNSDNGIIFGTRSFWEGIDIKGDKLTTVVIIKLPFKSKNDPLFFNKETLLKNNGKNPFFELMLPDMILSLKQGIGRLIRSKTDFGKVFILDDRFLNSRYSNKIIKNFSNYNIEKYDV